MKKKITLIAEIGENYLGKLNLAKKMILEAKKAGADYAKFQSYNELCLKKNDPEYNWFKKVSLTDKNHIKRKNALHADELIVDNLGLSMSFNKK